MPDFVKRAMGPALEQLPSYTKKNDKMYAQELAQKVKGEGIAGLGEVMETLHADMRLLGARVGRLFAPAMGNIPMHNLIGDRFNPAEVVYLMGLHEVPLRLNPNNPEPLIVRGHNIVYKAFMMGAEARAHLSRTDEERDMLKKSVGTLRASYMSLLDLLGAIGKSMKESPAYRNTTLADMGLAPNTSKIAEAFAARQKQFSEAYNYMYVITYGGLDPRLQSLKWAIEGREAPQAGIRIETSHEAAATIAALYERLYPVTRLQKRKFCEELARQTPREAAAMMQKAETLDELNFLKAMLSKPETDFMTGILNELQRFEEHALGTHARPNMGHANKEQHPKAPVTGNLGSPQRL
ncbi:MAG: hypothetical protein EBV03_04630 [Proteobacteria bacterium]|nr:hypothetical protein [Pseudomonadota bacterium]